MPFRLWRNGTYHYFEQFVIGIKLAFQRTQGHEVDRMAIVKCTSALAKNPGHDDQRHPILHRLAVFLEFDACANSLCSTVARFAGIIWWQPQLLACDLVEFRERL